MHGELVPTLKNEDIEASYAENKDEKEFFAHENTTITKINAAQLSKMAQNISDIDFAVITCAWETMQCRTGLMEMNMVTEELGDKLINRIFYMDSVKNKMFLRNAKFQKEYYFNNQVGMYYKSRENVIQSKPTYGDQSLDGLLSFDYIYGQGFVIMVTEVLDLSKY